MTIEMTGSSRKQKHRSNEKGSRTLGKGNSGNVYIVRTRTGDKKWEVHTFKNRNQAMKFAGKQSMSGKPTFVEGKDID